MSEVSTSKASGDFSGESSNDWSRGSAIGVSSVDSNASSRGSAIGV